MRSTTRTARRSRRSVRARLPRRAWHVMRGTVAAVVVLVIVAAGGVTESERAESIPPSSTTTNTLGPAPSTTLPLGPTPAITAEVVALVDSVDEGDVVETSEADDDTPVESTVTTGAPASSATTSTPGSAPSVTARPGGTLAADLLGPGEHTGVFGTAGPIIAVYVEVESGLPIDPTEARREVTRILADPRGWTATGTVRFELVDEPGLAQAHLLIASPDTVDARCWPLRTVGRLSCRNGNGLNINADRWLGATDFWDQPLAEYRAYVVNHEMGHLLGNGHRACPGPGAPAPVMLPQTKGLQGCTGNGWPHPDA